MTTLESMLFATLKAHALIGMEEDAGWRYLCRCKSVTNDHDEHVAQQLASVGIVDGVRWTQLPLFL
jgi:hypothetical protein